MTTDTEENKDVVGGLGGRSDVVVVGSGPAGLSAALYTSRAGLRTIVVQGETPGGLLSTTDQIDNYLGMFGISGIDMARNFLEHAQKFGAELAWGDVMRIDRCEDGSFLTVLDDDSVLVSRAVIFAAGSQPRRIGVPGEDLHGVSYCATCDGFFFEGEDVAVIGGGETAVEDARYLSNLARHVDVLVRSTWRASQPAVRDLEAQDNVTVHLGENAAVIETDGNDGVSGVITTSGRHLTVSGVFIAAGQVPNSDTAGDHVTLFQNGFIKFSNVPGLIIAGDITNPDHRQVAVAVGDGARAGIDATRFLI